jgi:NADH-quinone oxidoreductase subunit H
MDDLQVLLHQIGTSWDAFLLSPGGWFAWTVGHILLITVVLLLTIAFVIYGDRKIFAGVQARKGPNVVGPFGLLQSFADLGKFLIKELVIPAGADKAVFLLAPLISVTLALGAWAVMPIAPGWSVSNINVGVLYLFAACLDARRPCHPKVTT